MDSEIQYERQTRIFRDHTWILRQITVLKLLTLGADMGLHTWWRVQVLAASESGSAGEHLRASCVRVRCCSSNTDPKLSFREMYTIFEGISTISRGPGADIGLQTCWGSIVLAVSESGSVGEHLRASCGCVRRRKVPQADQHGMYTVFEP